MKLANVAWQGAERVGVVDPDSGVVSVKETTQDQIWEAPFAQQGVVSQAKTLTELPLAETTLLPPVPRPPKLICVAANYLEHLREGGNSDPVGDARPQLFMKPPSTTLVGHNAVVKLPPHTQFFDWEGELAVVIGRRLRRAADRKEALSAVVGYSAFNDLSERQLKFDPREDVRKNTWFFDWLAGKWFDGGAPMGPWLVTADEIGDPQNLKISLDHNGKTVQDSTTGAMMCPVDDIVWYASQVMTLEPGDIIATGTPSGVGAALGIKIVSGDVTTVKVEGIGELTTHYQDEES